jgi:hypothetical protein
MASVDVAGRDQSTNSDLQPAKSWKVVRSETGRQYVETAEYDPTGNHRQVSLASGSMLQLQHLQ